MRILSRSILLLYIVIILAAVPVFAAASENVTTAASGNTTTAASENTTTEASENTTTAASENTTTAASEDRKAGSDKAVQDQTSKKQTTPIQIESTERGLVITWPAVPEADNYMLYRAADGGKLENVVLAKAVDQTVQNNPVQNNPDQKTAGQVSSGTNGTGQSDPAKSEPAITYPLPAVADPLQTITDSQGQVTGYSYTDSLILPGKSYHYYIQTYHKKTDTWNYYDREGAEGVWNITPLQIRAGTQLTEEAVRQLGEDTFFAVQEISEKLFQERLYGKSYKEYCDIPLENLRYIRCLHRDIDGNIKVGELVMNTKCADRVCEIFHELYRQSYPIESMLLVDDFNASDEDSIMHNNTSAFNYRTVDNTAELSNHAFGLAIDINPYYNVYYIPSENYVFPPEGWAYLDREADFPYKLTEGDLCYNLFINAGFSWGGYFTYNIDYQHFYINP